jgi:hypothetical protein
VFNWQACTVPPFEFVSHSQTKAAFSSQQPETKPP